MLRRRVATSAAADTATARQTKPKTGLGSLPSPNDADGPRSSPARCGDDTNEPPGPAPHDGFSNPNRSIATAAAIVTTARLTPRTRSADTAVRSPNTVAIAVPSSGPHGNPIPHCIASFET